MKTANLIGPDIQVYFLELLKKEDLSEILKSQIQTLHTKFSFINLSSHQMQDTQTLAQEDLFSYQQKFKENPLQFFKQHAIEGLEVHFLMSEMMKSDYFVHSQNVQMSQVCDFIFLKDQRLHTFQVETLAVLDQLQNIKLTTDATKSCVLVGSFEFVLKYILLFSRIGFKKIKVLFTDEFQVDPLEKISKSIFKTQIDVISIDDLGELSSEVQFLMTQYNLDDFADLTQVIEYYNFMLPNSFFIDLYDYKNSRLVNEAHKSGLCVIPSLQIHLAKYQKIINKISNISSLV